SSPPPSPGEWAERDEGPPGLSIRTTLAACSARCASALADDLTTHEIAHDLVGAAVDAVHAGVGERLRDRVLHDVAVAAVQLHAHVEHLPLALGRPELHLRGVLGGELAVLVR